LRILIIISPALLHYITCEPVYKSHFEARLSICLSTFTTPDCLIARLITSFAVLFTASYLIIRFQCPCVFHSHSATTRLHRSVNHSSPRASCGLRGCKNSTHSVSWPETLKGLPNGCRLSCFWLSVLVQSMVWKDSSPK